MRMVCGDESVIDSVLGLIRLAQGQEVLTSWRIGSQEMAVFSVQGRCGAGTGDGGLLSLADFPPMRILHRGMVVVVGGNTSNVRNVSSNSNQ
jgi:hypothetical protein